MDYDLDFVTEIPSDKIENNFVGQEECSHGFKFWIETCTKPSALGNLVRIKLCSEPCNGCDGYQLLCDYRITFLAPSKIINQRNLLKELPELFVQFEIITKGASSWNDESDWILQLTSEELKTLISTVEEENKTLKLRTQIKIREVLVCSKENYKEETGLRNFAILVECEAFYVNLNYLSSLGSSYFENMLESKNKGVSRTVLFSVTAKEFGEFLDALCTYRKPLITNRNFELVLNLANHFFVEAALRACEMYLIQCDNIHIVRKLEYAAEFGLGLLGESLLRKLHNGSPYAHLEALHSYMQINGERLDQQHPDVLNALCVYEDFVIY